MWEEHFWGLAFKIQTDPHVGRITYVRVYSGKLQSGSYTYNATKGERERVGRLLLMHANQREEVSETFSGEIVAIVGLKSTKTGDTLCDEDHPIILEGISFAEPVISLAIEPKTKSDQERMGMALGKLAEEDPTFRIKTNQETGQTIIAGMGELHLEILVDRMKREFKVEANVGAPQVAYRETIKKIAMGEGKYIKQSGGRGQYGHCWLRVEPKNRGEGYEWVREVKGGNKSGNLEHSNLAGLEGYTPDGECSNKLPAWPPNPASTDEWREVLRLDKTVEPAIRRVVDGMDTKLDSSIYSYRNERLRAVGNGVVPVVAAYAFTVLYNRLMRGVST